MAQKTYISRNPHLALSRPVPGVLASQVKEDPILFVAGVFKTDDLDEQKFIEASDSFARGVIRLEDPASVLAEAQAKAQALRQAATAAAAAADAADAVVKGLLAAAHAPNAAPATPAAA